MPTSPLFTETQRFRQPWLFVALFLVVGIFLFAFIQQAIFDKPFGNNPTSVPGLIVFGTIPIGLLLLLWFSKLETRIDAQGVTVDFKPFMFKPRFTPWAEVRSVEVREYKPIREFGGWGLRYGFNKRAYNVSGNVGIEFTFMNGKTMLLGTQKAEEARLFLESRNKN